MPALKYDYDYYNQYSRNKKGVANSARSISATKAVSNNTRKKVKNDIDIPVMVKKKVNIEKPREMKLEKPKSKNKKALKLKSVVTNILCGAIVAFMLFTVCLRYTVINEKFNEVNSLKKELDSAKALNEQLNTNIESKTDLNYIEKYAKYQLGMQKPKDNQIVRINYAKQDKISTPVVIEETKELSFFEKLFNDLLNLVD